MDNISLYSIFLHKTEKKIIFTANLLQAVCVADLHLYIKGVKYMALLWASWGIENPQHVQFSVLNFSSTYGKPHSHVEHYRFLWLCVQNPYQIVTASELWGIYTCHGCPYGKFTIGSGAEVWGWGHTMGLFLQALITQ